MIELDEVCKTYPSGENDRLEVLRNCSWSLKAGATASVVGPSGSGKSTLLHLLGGLDQPDAGTIKVGEVDPTQLKEKDAAAFRRDTVGFIFQAHHLLPQLTALENVLLPTLAGMEKRDLAQDEARAHELLKRVGLAERASHEPGRLSGGERQRVAVARALMLEPKVLLADEPTGALDGRTARALADLLFEISAGNATTLVVVTHDLTLAGSAQRIFRLQDGQLVAS